MVVLSPRYGPMFCIPIGSPAFDRAIGATVDGKADIGPKLPRPSSTLPNRTLDRAAIRLPHLVKVRTARTDRAILEQAFDRDLAFYSIVA
jgi:hypothetical protein